MNALVIGGTGFIGRTLVAELLKSGHAVSILHRKPVHDLGRRVKNIVPGIGRRTSHPSEMVQTGVEVLQI